MMGKNLHGLEVTPTAQSLLDSAPVGIYWKNTDGIFLGCNQLQALLFKLASPEMIIGKKNSDFFEPQQASTLKNIEHQVICDQKSPLYLMIKETL